MSNIPQGYLFSLLPEGVRLRLGTEGERFLSLFDAELDELKEEIDDIVNLVDVDNCPVELLPYLGALVGLDTSELYGVPTEDYREQVKWAVRVWKNKGSLAGILYFCRVALGLPTEVRPYRLNLLTTWHPTIEITGAEPRTWDNTMTGKGTASDSGYYSYGGKYKEGSLGFWISPSAEGGIGDAFAKFDKIEKNIKRYISITTTPYFDFLDDAISNMDILTKPDDGGTVEEATEWIYPEIDYGVLEEEFDALDSDFEDLGSIDQILALGDLFEEVISILSPDIQLSEFIEFATDATNPTALVTHRLYAETDWLLIGEMTYEDESTEIRQL